MNQQEARKLIDLVNYEVKYNPNHREWILEETWYPDHSGKLPVYIVDVLTSEGLVIDRHDIMVYAMQASNNVLVFLIPDYKNHEMGKKILGFNGKLKGAVNRYAELSVTMYLGKNYEYIPTVEDITFLSNDEMNEKGSAL